MPTRVRQQTWPQLLTLHEKHDEPVYVVDSLEELDAVARALILQRVKDSWILPPDEKPYVPMEVALNAALTDEQIDSLPNSNQQAAARMRRERAQRLLIVAQRDLDVEKVQWKIVEAIQADPSRSTIKDGRSAAWDYLTWRSEGEYEGLELSDLRHYPLGG